jgi:hypothetical protein
MMKIRDLNLSESLKAPFAHVGMTGFAAIVAYQLYKLKNR